MPSVVREASQARRESTGTARRSARLSTPSAPRGSMTPRSETLSRIRLHDGARPRGTPDASAWGSSLYTTDTARDLSVVSSFYLRSQPQDGAAERSPAAPADDSDLFTEGAPLFPGGRYTPEPAARTSTYEPEEDYTQEEQFMSQAEEQWHSQHDAHQGLRTPGTKRAVPTTPGMPTPHVPGLFQSARRVRHVDPNESQASEHPSFQAGDDEPSARRPTLRSFLRRRKEQAEEKTEPASAAPRTDRKIPLWVRLCMVVLAVYTLYAALRHTVPPFRKDAVAPLIEKPWPVPASSSSSMDDVRRRMDALETAVNKVWRSIGDVGAEVKHSHTSLTERMRALEEKSALQTTVDALETQVRELRAGHKERTALWEDEVKAHEALLERLVVVEQRSAPAGGSALADPTAESIRAKLAELDVRLTRAAQQAQHAAAAAAEAQATTDTLRDVLPEQMPVRYDPHTKQLRVDPGLYHELRKVLAADTAKAQEKPSSWTAFLEANRGELETLFASTVKDHLHARTASGMLLDRDAFLTLLKAELAHAKTELNTRFNENVHELQSDLLAKVRQQQEMYEETGSWHRPSFLHESKHGSRDVAAMIDAALATFAADQIARADYAQYSAGGRVLPALTSPTHEMRVAGDNVHSFVSMLQTVLPLPRWTPANAAHTVRGRMPAVALHHDTSPGMCWPFSGTHGQLGIQLVRKVHIAALTIDHLPPSLALDDLASAPRDMEAWGLVETDEERRQLVQWRAKRARLARQGGDVDGVDPTPVPPSPSHVYLGSFAYDIQGPPIQTFPVTSEGAALALPFRVVQLNVLSNHGLREFTCLYRVRVHGDVAHTS